MCSGHIFIKANKSGKWAHLDKRRENHENIRTYNAEN